MPVADQSEIIFFRFLKGRCHGNQVLLAFPTQLSFGHAIEFR